MIVHCRTAWTIGVTIALLVLLASLSFSTSAKLRKPRKRLVPRVPQQHQFRDGPVIVRVIHGRNSELTQAAQSSDCAGGAICGNARPNKLDPDAVVQGLSDREHFLPDQESLRYIVYPKKYEHFVSRKNTGSSRYRRQVAPPESIDLSKASEPNGIASNRSDGKTSGEPRNGSKAKLKKVTLLKAPLKRVWMKEEKPSRWQNEGSRSRRSLDAPNFSPRRNASDYYAQRRAVMEKYYARQREINARYANRTSNATTLFRLGLEQANRNSTTRDNDTLPRRPQVMISSIYGNESHHNRIDRNQTMSGIERNALDYYVTPTPCAKVSLSGTSAPKRLRHIEDCHQETGSNEDSDEDASIEESNEEGHRTWGKCKGKLVYQHNLRLGLTGPSNLESLFEVFIDDFICITCVKAIPYNNTSAMVNLDSGGRGHGYVKLKLEGYKNQGFSYIIKIWAVRKTEHRDCDI